MQAEAQRDLRSQINDLGSQEMSEIQITEWSPGRQLISLWNTITGEEIKIPQYMVMNALNKTKRGGGYLFTANSENAPKVKEGQVACFLAEHSSERESGLLAEAGLDMIEPCLAEHLGSNFSKRVHATNLRIS